MLRDQVRVKAPGKINLALRVGALGADGYHPLTSIFQAVSIYDEVTVTPAARGQYTVNVTGTQADQVPTDESNLAVKAAMSLADMLGSVPCGVHIEISKAIPVAGGMAGGSADAAATLLACSTLWQASLSTEELCVIGATLGADVPFPLVGGIAVGTGRGDKLVPALVRGSYHWVLALSDGELSTPKVFGRFDELRSLAPPGSLDTRLRREPASSLVRPSRLSGVEERSDEHRDPLAAPPELMNGLAAGEPRVVGRHLVNDLQDAAISLRPELRRVLDAGIELGAWGAVVSGSGPTVAFLVADQDVAIDLSVALSAERVCHRVRRVTGPVPGARIVG